MKRIGFYIASSIEGFEDELDGILAFLNSLGDRLVDSGILVTAMTGGRSDLETIAESSQFWLLVGERFEEASRDEFEEALRDFRDGGRPSIVTYFRDLPEGVVPDEGVEAFKARLGEELGHYYSTFSHPDSVKLGMVMELSEDPELHRELFFKDGRVFLGELDVLSLDDVSLYARNAEATRLREAIQKLDAAYDEAYTRYASEGLGVLRQHADPIAEEQRELSMRLNKLEEELLNLYRRIHIEMPKGSVRVRKASELLEKGNYKGALAILDDEERDRELERAEMRIAVSREQRRLADEEEAAALQQVSSYISEERLRISVLLAESESPEHIGEVDDSYRKLCELVRRYEIEMDVLLDYAKFLTRENRYPDAATIAEEYLAFQKSSSVPSGQLAETLNLLGLIYKDENHYVDAERLLRESLEMRKALAECDPDGYLSDVGISTFNVANLLFVTGHFDEADSLHREAVGIFRRLAERDPGAYLPYVAASANSLAILLKDTGRFGDAEPLHREALGVRRRLAERDPAVYLPDVAASANNLANLLGDTGRYGEAESLHREALGVRRRLAERDPGTYLPYVASSANNLAILLNDTGRSDEAEPLHREALGVRRRLAERDPGAYLPDVAASANNLANLLGDTGRYGEAESLHREALGVRRRLAERDPGAYLPDVAASANNLAALLTKTGIFDEAELLFREALEARRKLSERNPSVYKSDVAKSAGGLVILLIATGRVEEVEPFLYEAEPFLNEIIAQQKNMPDSKSES